LVLGKYNFERVKNYIEKLPNIKDKIIYLTEIKTEYLQQKNSIDFHTGASFDKQCDLEIKRIKDIASLETQPKTTEQQSKFILSTKRGNKTDFIRILDALYELKFFQTLDGQYPTKEAFMKQVGIFFGADFSDYDKDRSQALNASIEANLKIFEEMKQIIQKAHIDKESK
jgi:hypothetical protein